MSVLKDYTRTNGTLVTLRWSRQGKFADRKRVWGQTAVVTWKAQRLGDDVWLLPQGLAFAVVDEWLRTHLTAADRAVVAFPYGSKTGDASTMSVYTYNVAKPA